MKTQVLLASFAVLAVTAAAQQPQAASSGAQARQPAPSFGVAATEGLTTPAVDPLTISILQSSACPVTMKAGFSTNGGMVKVRKPGSQDPPSPPDGKPAQHIRLELAAPKNPIASVRVTAYGLTARRRVDRSSDPMVKGPSDIRRTMDVQFTHEKDGSLSAELVLPGFTAVKSVKLESITYADGTIRGFSGKQVCSVPVNPMMLISER